MKHTCKILVALLVLMTILMSLAVVAIPASAAGETATFKKVTSAPSDWSGTYLIVYESGKVAFNSSLSTLDAVGNKSAVTISNSEITADLSLAFTIEKNGNSYTIKSSSGYYVGQSSNANGLKSNKTTKYNNTITLNSDGTVNIVSGGAYLR